MNNLDPAQTDIISDQAMPTMDNPSVPKPRLSNTNVPDIQGVSVRATNVEVSRFGNVDPDVSGSAPSITNRPPRMNQPMPDMITSPTTTDAPLANSPVDVSNPNPAADTNPTLRSRWHQLVDDVQAQSSYSMDKFSQTADQISEMEAVDMKVSAERILAITYAVLVFVTYEVLTSHKPEMLTDEQGDVLKMRTLLVSMLLVAVLSMSLIYVAPKLVISYINSLR